MNLKFLRLSPKWLWCLGLIILGTVFILFCPGYDFSGLFLLGLAALIPLYHGIDLVMLHHPPLGKGLRMCLTIFLVLFFLAMILTVVPIITSSLGTGDGNASYVVVLGAGVNGTTPSRSLRERLDEAYVYLLEHPHTIAIVSGGQGPDESISEAECMSRYLLAKGISEDRIWQENQSTSTRENLLYSLELIRQNTGSTPEILAIVTSEYHLHRAQRFANALGVEAELIPARTGILPLRWNYYLREIFSIWYYSLFGGFSYDGT